MDSVSFMETEPYGLDLVMQRQRDARDQNAESCNEEERNNDANPATRVPILTKPKQRKLQAMEIESNVVSRCRSSGRKKQQCKNPATQALILTKPRQRKLQAMEIGSDVWFLTAATVEEKNTLESGFDLFTGFWGLEVEMWDGI